VQNKEVTDVVAVSSARGVALSARRIVDGVVGVYLLAIAWLVAGVELALVVAYATGHLR
jgi:hypothetical protein